MPNEIGGGACPQQAGGEAAFLERLGEHAMRRCRELGEEHEAREHHGARGETRQHTRGEEPSAARIASSKRVA